MIAVRKLRGLMAEQGISQKELANALGISAKTFYNKMQKGVFGTDEAEKLIEILKIENPADIFFTNKVTLKVTTTEESA